MDLIAAIASLPFIVGGVTAVVVPGPASKRITYGVVAGILCMVAAGTLRLVVGVWA